MAKEQKQPEPPPVPDVPAATGPSKPYRLYITLGFVCTILFEVIIMFLLIPAKPVEQRTGSSEIDPHNIGNVSGAPQPVIKSEAMVECPIGDKNTFNITNVRDDGSEVFKVTINVKIRKADAGKFNLQYELCKNEIIDRVTVILNASTTAERKEAEHTAIKERVKRAINEVLGQPWIQTVFFSEITHEAK